MIPTTSEDGFPAMSRVIPVFGFISLTAKIPGRTWGHKMGAIPIVPVRKNGENSRSGLMHGLIERIGSVQNLNLFLAP